MQIDLYPDKQRWGRISTIGVSGIDPVIWLPKDLPCGLDRPGRGGAL
jgi:hypothetical protein